MTISVTSRPASPFATPLPLPGNVPVQRGPYSPQARPSRHLARRRGARHLMATPALRPKPRVAPEPPGLVLIAGGRTMPLTSEPVIVGRGMSADWQLSGRHVSARHAMVVADGLGGVLFKDLNSTNGSWRRGERLATGTLKLGDAIVLGRTPMLVGTYLTPHPGSGSGRGVLWHGIVACAPKSLEVLAAVGAAAASEAPVWVSGPSGTGKEGVAAAIHACSRRAEQPYIRLNCAALPETLAEAALFGAEQGGYTGARKRLGAFRAAHGGTLLLDEVGELSLAVQAKLLRVLETGELQTVGSDRPTTVDVRVVASTWRDMEADAAAGRFRFDLLQRLNGLKIDIPPLDSRPEDLGPLVDRFLGALKAPGLFPDKFTLAALRSASWPGNVRGLKNAVRRACIAGSWEPVVGPSRRVLRSIGDFAADGRRWATDGPEGKERKQLAEKAIAASMGNRAGAARVLGISRSTLYRWLAQTG